jgi:hypothetical protein
MFNYCKSFFGERQILRVFQRTRAQRGSLNYERLGGSVKGFSRVSVEAASNAIHLHEIKKFVTNSYLTPDLSPVGKYLQNESKEDYKYMCLQKRMEGEACGWKQRIN